MKTIAMVGIALAISVGILGAVLVVGEMYQQELFEEYIEDSQNSQNKRTDNNPNLPYIDLMP